jgi:hypothetical protein
LYFGCIKIEHGCGDAKCSENGSCLMKLMHVACDEKRYLTFLQCIVPCVLSR